MACAGLGLKEMWGGCRRCSASAWQRADQIAALRVKLESGQSMPPNRGRETELELALPIDQSGRERQN